MQKQAKQTSQNRRHGKRVLFGKHTFTSLPGVGRQLCCFCSRPWHHSPPRPGSISIFITGHEMSRGAAGSMADICGTELYNATTRIKRQLFDCLNSSERLALFG